jgi:hypothetical protein
MFGLGAAAGAVAVVFVWAFADKTMEIRSIAAMQVARSFRSLLIFMTGVLAPRFV